MRDDGFIAYGAKRAAALALEAEILPANKVVLFQALSDVGIHTVVVSFDGYGDEGQIESVVARDVDGVEVANPLVDLTVKEVAFDDCAIIETLMPPRDLIETMAYKFLEQTHRGWENGDGACGEFTFDVAEQSITLEYNERYIETHYHEHEF